MSAVTPLEMPAERAVKAPFEVLSRAFREQGGLGYSDRMTFLDRLGEGLKRWEERLATAVSDDFGSRSRHETAVAEIFPSLATIKYLRKHLRGWMRPERRHIGLIFMPAAGRVVRQPLGVVGIIAPWNYPIQLAIIPLMTAIAAGNRVLIKPSELTPRTSEALRGLLSEVFPHDVVGVVTGGADVGAAFSRLPFDHLLFTGSTSVGRHVMRAAAENLVPVTLELGGKSPAIVHGDYPLDHAVQRIAVGKLLNAGQTCIAPDYALVPEDKVEPFVAEFQTTVAKLYPRLADNPDYSAIVSERHYARLVDLVADAKQRGARVVEVNPASETFAASARKLPPTLIIGAPDEAPVMQDEIFGPVLPIVAYKSLADAIAYVNARPRPLALYYFDRDASRVRQVLSQTTSGGACVNETLLHIAQDDLPFGGVGPSGLGAYHGREGFETFSHRKSVFHQARWNSASLLLPPYGQKMDRLLNLLVGKGAKRR
jgi:coniferyl-aldehyde dehydrogenase